MTDITTNIKPNRADINAQINILMNAATSIKKGIADCSTEFSNRMNAMSKKIDSSISGIEKICSELDQIDESAGVAIDEFILDQTKNLTED